MSDLPTQRELDADLYEVTNPSNRIEAESPPTAAELDPSLVLMLTDELARSAKASETPTAAAERVLTALTVHGRLIDPSDDLCRLLARIDAAYCGTPQQAAARAAFLAAVDAVGTGPCDGSLGGDRG